MKIGYGRQRTNVCIGMPVQVNSHNSDFYWEVTYCTCFGNISGSLLLCSCSAGGLPIVWALHEQNVGLDTCLSVPEFLFLCSYYTIHFQMPFIMPLSQ